MVPELTRRRLLGGLSVAGTGAGIAAAPRTWYPDPVVDRMIGRRRLPETDARPPVPEAVLEEGLDSFADHLDRAEALWAEIDDDRDDLPDAARYGRLHLSIARDRYEDLRGASADRGALFDLRRAHGDAGFAIGTGRLARGETDAEALIDRGARLRDEIDDVHEGVEYRGNDPAADAATLFRIEEALVSVRINSHRDGIYMGGVAPPDEYDSHAFPRTWKAHLQAEVALLEARHTARAFEDGIDGTATRSFADGIGAAFDAFADEVDRTRQSYEEREALLEDLPDGPYRHTRFQCWQLTHGDLDALFGGLRAELQLSRTVHYARNVLKLRAYPDAVERFELDEDPDPALAYRTERRAARRLRDLVDERDSPLFRLVVEDAARLLRNGHVGLRHGRGSTARKRAKAYVYYLLADAQLRHAADVYGDLLAEFD